MANASDSPLKVLHVFRAPVGGIFRHVRDVAEGQLARGHQVGFIVDSLTGGERAEAALAEIAPRLPLGVNRYPISRQLSPSDAAGLYQVWRRIKEIGPDVVHGHGAKGGAYARLASPSDTLRIYTPHGGSLHYSAASPVGLVYLMLERSLMRRTDAFLFESRFAEETFRRKVAQPKGTVRVVYNGVTPSEFQSIAPAPDAADIVFIGELRELKGVDVLIEAVGQLRQIGRPATATIVGDGPDAASLHARTTQLGLADHVRFVGPLPARQAFTLGRVLAVPSRAESLPYVVLEAAAAGIPMVTTRVGGIPEIFGPQTFRLIEPGAPGMLAETLKASLDDRAGALAAAETLKARVATVFSADAMVEGILRTYRDARAARTEGARERG